MINIWDALFNATKAMTSKYDPIVSSLLTENQKLKSKLSTIEELKNSVYSGRELSEFTWEELRTIAANGTATENNIFIGDYKTIDIKGHSVKMQVAGIDTYYKSFSHQQSLVNYYIGHHIDFISKDCYPEPIIWKNDNNNGISNYKNPYMNSDLHNWLNDDLDGYLPEDVVRVMKSKNIPLEERYSASGLVTSSTGSRMCTFVHLWIPTEYEVFGSSIVGHRLYSSGYGVQYPIFANTNKTKIKGLGDGGDPCRWWTNTVYEGDNTSAVHVTENGSCSIGFTSVECYVPICFRIG